jgi:hypothetical protein
MKILLVGDELFLEDRRIDGWTDGRTDMTKLIVAVRSFANEPKNSTYRLFFFYIQYIFALCSLTFAK